MIDPISCESCGYVDPAQESCTDPVPCPSCDHLAAA